MNQTEYATIIRRIKDMWPHGTKDWTADTLKSWEPLLQDLDPMHTVAAILAIASEGAKWPPAAGEVRRMALELASPMPTADAAWSEVTGWIAKIGTRRHTMDFATGDICEPVWSDPLIGRIADSIGWDQLCASENVMADRAHFLRMWAEAVTRQRAVDHLPPVAAAALAARGVPMLNLSADRELAS